MSPVKLLSCLLLIGVACTPGTDPPQTAGDARWFEGARLLIGDGTAPIEDSVFQVEDGRFTVVGERGEVEVPAGVVPIDLTGKTVMPAIIDLHSHPGASPARGLPAAEDPRADLIDQLSRAAYYGIGTVVSLGGGGELHRQVRDEGAHPNRARFLVAGRRLDGRRVKTEEEARAAVQELATQNVDIIKIGVDDRGGTEEKLTPLRAISDEARKHGLIVAAHIFYLEDGKEVARSGIDGFAHGVRDRDVDDEFLQLLTARPEVFYSPALPSSGTPVDLSWLGETLTPEQRQQLLAIPPRGSGRPASANGTRNPGAVRNSPELTEFFWIQARNLQTVNEAGLRVALGTDGRRFTIGWSAHTQMEDMVLSGMTPAEVIVAATQTPAEILGLHELGTVVQGKIADFLVLDANPLEAITNTPSIAQIYLRGDEVDRPALRTLLKP